jgi:hypothetical protein
MVALIKKYIQTTKMSVEDVPAFATNALTLYGAAVWEIPQSDGVVSHHCPFSHAYT